jgi:hypothetical protein
LPRGRRTRCSSTGCRRPITPGGPDVCIRCARIRLAQAYRLPSARKWLTDWMERLRDLLEDRV